eukprot:scpid23060/ scgid10654/ 5-oxoprolinase; 5-oxo-L-prolinase; Pyroglutamase
MATEPTGDRPGFSFAIDRGGTFTDVFAMCPDGTLHVSKLLSEDPARYSDAPREAIRRVLEEVTGKTYPKDEPLPSELITSIRMGTTVATNALLERRGEPCALAISSGFKDLLCIGNQARPSIFDLKIEKPEVLSSEVVEVSERVILEQDDDKLKIDAECRRVKGVTGETVIVTKSLNEDKLRKDLQPILDRGIRSLAVVLLHSYTFREHEEAVGRIAQDMGFTHVSLSCQIMPMVRAVPRGYTACADAYLTPCIKRYLNSFASGFQDNLKSTRVQFMQSDGGLTPMDKFCGSKAILSGPAGGVVGYALTTAATHSNSPVIGFDMGGTSTDVSRYHGSYEHVFEATIAGVTIQSPQLDINTVAAGGGSRLFFRAGMFVVGPESAGANPGPVCYGKGGPLAVTDANLVLGRLLPEYFPKIFGPNEDQPLDRNAAIAKFDELTEEVNAFLATQQGSDAQPPMTRNDLAVGFLKVANEAMCRPIRALTQGKGYDTSRHVLACFGGAGGQHACAIARNLGMKRVFVHRFAGILSAYGMALADVVHEEQEPCAVVYHKHATAVATSSAQQSEQSSEQTCSSGGVDQESAVLLNRRLKELTNRAVAALKDQGFDGSHITTTPYLHLRYRGTDCALMCPPPPPDAERQISDDCLPDFYKTFIERYQREFGFTLRRDILVDDVRVRATGHSNVDQTYTAASASGDAPVAEWTECYFNDKHMKTPVYRLDDLAYGHTLHGPLVIINNNSTIVVEPHCTASITQTGDIDIELGQVQLSNVGTTLDTIQLSIFSHRFMSIAEQMGRVLQRTAISTNIKERLDFSCAVFGEDGGLVANAPHIPVHLGAMQETVQMQMRIYGNDLNPGDALLCNHPSAGGSHLPDLTIITPVFYGGSEKPTFFVANRGHHADIGGITPGSMPPHSRFLAEEGMAVKTFKITKRGVFQEEDMIELLTRGGEGDDNVGTRRLSDNMSDLEAQLAANHKGVDLLSGLIEEYSLDVVQAYMKHIQDNAEVAVRRMLRSIASDRDVSELSAVDYMDDGTPLNLRITIDKTNGSAVFDFSGTGPQVYGNCNAPRAVVLSAVIYCLRCMVGYDVPLNQGCLAPIQVIIPRGTILSADDTAAVVGGNVLTSQRLVDVIFRAFQACAASQGCMNNITFGDESFGYYETVAGGAGAGPNWTGGHGVHTHMTNTRITDPEIVERRYPVVVEKFSLRAGSGGGGRHAGGDGVVREMLFRRPLQLSVLTERRARAPYGLAGGEAGQMGMNLLTRADGRVINLGAKVSVDVGAGDTFHLLTPGGGGYGNASSSSGVDSDANTASTSGTSASSSSSS